jgi:hypothetical protein
MSFFSGAIKDVEAFMSGVEKPLMADFGPVIAKVRTEFSDALGNLAEAEYESAKSIIRSAWSSAVSASNGNLGVALSAAFNASKGQLASAGIQIAEKSVLCLLTSIIAI